MQQVSYDWPFKKCYYPHWSSVELIYPQLFLMQNCWRTFCIVQKISVLRRLPLVDLIFILKGCFSPVCIFGHVFDSRIAKCGLTLLEITCRCFMYSAYTSVCDPLAASVLISPSHSRRFQRQTLPNGLVFCFTLGNTFHRLEGSPAALPFPVTSIKFNISD